MSAEFRLMLTVKQENIHVEVQFKDAVNHEVLNRLQKTIHFTNNEQLADVQLKMTMDNYLWKVMRDNRFNCCSIEWK